MNDKELPMGAAAQPEPGMSVVAEDGPLGVVESLEAISAASRGAPRELVIRDQLGTLRRLLQAMIHHIDGATIYLNVPGGAVPIIPLPGATLGDDASDEVAIPLAEERLEVDTRVVELGKAHVRKVVDERVDERQVPLDYQEVHVERVPVDRVVTQTFAPYMDGDVLVVPVVEEEIVEVVVRRQLRLKEELRITRRTRQRQQTIHLPVRSERVDVEEEWVDAGRDDEPNAPAR